MHPDANILARLGRIKRSWYCGEYSKLFTNSSRCAESNAAHLMASPGKLTSSVGFKALPAYFVALQTEFLDEQGEDETHGAHTRKRQEDRHESNPI